MNRRSDYSRGVLAMIASSLFFSVMALLVRTASGIDPYKATFFRFVVGMALLVTLALFRKIKLEFVASRVLFFRGFMGGVAVFLFYISIYKLGIARGTVINNTSPIFAALGGLLFLKENVRPAVWPLMALALIGIFLLCPEWKAAAPEETVWFLAAILGAVTSGAAIVSVKKLSRTDSPYAIFMAQCLFGFWLLFIPSTMIPLRLGLTGGILLIAIGLSAAVAQLLMTWSYSKIEISTGSLIGMLSPVINILVGMIFFGEQLGFRGIIGVLLILASCTAIVVLNRKPAGPLTQAARV